MKVGGWSRSGSESKYGPISWAAESEREKEHMITACVKAIFKFFVMLICFSVGMVLGLLAVEGLIWLASDHHRPARVEVAPKR